VELTLQEAHGQPYIEGAPGHPLLTRLQDARMLVEASFEHHTPRLLLYPENLTPAFFDLSSREAGEILQSLRNYRIRLAIVRTPALQLSSRFGELLADEQRGPHFRLFDDRAAALAWLCAD
jgi:hypothetical protein